MNFFLKFYKLLLQFIFIVSLLFFASCEIENPDDEMLSSLPTISTTTAINITSNSALLGGNITSDGGATVTSRGVCWGLTNNPDTTFSKNLGSGTGQFTAIIDSLISNKRYYYRAFAVNSKGIVYGNTLNFKTLRVNPGFVLDTEGNSYPTVQIGEQIWMSENLKVNTYKDGTIIPAFLSPSEDFAITNAGAILRYSNPINDSIYGNLYNFLAVVDPRGLCPDGWHVPLNIDWYDLQNFLGDDNSLFGGSEFAGGKLKSTSNLWDSPNVGATNSSGFSALPGGFNADGMGTLAYWWSSDDPFDIVTNKKCFILAASMEQSFREEIGREKGLNVRCIMD